MNFTTLVLVAACIAASSAWHLRVSLNDIFKGHCRTVSPRVCRKSVRNFDPDYSCGFILRNVCSGKNKIERVRVRRSTLKVRDGMEFSIIIGLKSQNVFIVRCSNLALLIIRIFKNHNHGFVAAVLKQVVFLFRENVNTRPKTKNKKKAKKKLKNFGNFSTTI